MKQKESMHVVHMITKLEMGGAQKVCLTIKKGLDNQKIWSALISGDTGELVNCARDLPNSLFIKELKREVTVLGVFNECICFFKLIRYLRTLKKQYPNLIIHTHSTKAGLMGRWAAFFAGIKKRVHTIHGYGFQPEQNLCVRFCIYCVELITSAITTHYICVSTEDAKRGSKIFPCFGKKHSIIRAAVDWKQFYSPARKHQAVPLYDKPFIFGTIGGLSYRKNQIEILKAFSIAHSKYPHARLELIGDGDQRAVLVNWINEHQLQNVVVLHGWQQNVLPIMLNWHVFLLSSLWEGLPCVIVEARLLKLPVLTYAMNGVRDVIFQDYNGFIYKQRDYQSMANGMISLIENPLLYTKLSQYPDQLQDFNDTYMVHQHIELYKSF